jgi:gamma-D-glutamyl-L-lysine dipeptidyl-peptidase
MKRLWPFVPCAVVSLALISCASRKSASAPHDPGAFRAELRALQNRFAPDFHLAIYEVDFQQRENEITLSGEVDSDEARRETIRAAQRTGAKVTDQITVLPDAELGETNWGITTLSVANGREDAQHQAELGTQTLMGEVVRVLKRDGRWLLVQSHDQYISWMEGGSLKLCTRTEADAWEREPLLIVTELDTLIREAPEADAPPISDVVLGCRIKGAGDTGEWLKVELPDGRSGYLAKTSATDFATWKNSRRATPENIEGTGRQFIGRPYLWGANSPRGLDCSGFTKLTFFLNGIELRRNASQQAQQGTDVPLGDDLSHLKKGDLLFFGFEGREGRRGRVSHVGIYLGNKLFIQSSGRVRISSLDPDSPVADKPRIRGLIAARRILPGN